MKVKVLVEHTLELDIKKSDAFRNYPDCIDPVAAHIMDTIEANSDHKDWKVRDVIEHD